MNKQYCFLLLVMLLSSMVVFAQPERWQQRIKYNIDVTMNVNSHQFSGTEIIEYTNNSPDTLSKIFFHLYWNAFQPNSSMDVRSRELGKTIIGKDRNGNNVLDWDSRVTNRISNLTESEIGYQQVKSIIINGKEQTLIEHETILEVVLTKPILPKSNTLMKVTFDAQVPIQIRRSGRNSAEGIKYSMSQWFPKVVEYDYKGWNANPYVAREFYGVWGDFDVKITIDKNYMVAATGVLQNANTIGMGYTVAGYKPPRITTPTITWHFKAENVHDFVWAADPDYTHISKEVRKGLTLHVFYKSTTPYNDSAWNNILWAAEKALPYIEKRFGAYPYPQYSFIQGGDGGMEYAMATLIRGSGLGTVFHEWMHSWYQQILGTNESLDPWMDEGFTSYAEEEIMAWYNETHAWKSPWIAQWKRDAILKEVAEEKTELPLHQTSNYYGYFNLVKSPIEEPLTTHADHYNTNRGYGLSVYAKGGVFLAQLGYIVSDSVRDKILLEYYRVWKFKHPNANDFIRIAEKVSGLELQWYKEYWINSIKYIDYAVGNINVDTATSNAILTLKRLGKMPMPIDVVVTYKDGTSELHYIPLNLMFGQKPSENNTNRTVHTAWKWTHPEYTFSITRKINEIKSIEIDPTNRLADVNRSNNKLVIPD
ncbi:MAG: M1 family metallopeptidase [Chitinophagaceae bacterium]|nr:M1 family metallopeptidase [Chitinophagaceae bacterium]MCW5904852.1 M1 family metallopeptidase [Chitinophagaceae bacterium]